MDIYNKMFKNIAGFDWDTGNIDKNKDKHSVNIHECEEVFFNKPLLIRSDEKHSKNELRFNALGKSSNDRYLYLVFTIRKNNFRIISARDQSKKERAIYRAMVIKETI